MIIFLIGEKIKKPAPEGAYAIWEDEFFETREAAQKWIDEQNKLAGKNKFFIIERETP